MSGEEGVQRETSTGDEGGNGPPDRVTETDRVTEMVQRYRRTARDEARLRGYGNQGIRDGGSREGNAHKSMGFKFRFVSHRFSETPEGTCRKTAWGATSPRHAVFASFLLSSWSGRAERNSRGGLGSFLLRAGCQSSLLGTVRTPKETGYVSAPP